MSDYTFSREMQESSGERLVRIETLLGSMRESMERANREHEKELLSTRQLVIEHIKSTSNVGEDLRHMRKDMHDMQLRMKALETKVEELTRNKLWALAWAAGAGSMITLMAGVGVWIMKLFA